MEHTPESFARTMGDVSTAMTLLAEDVIGIRDRIATSRTDMSEQEWTAQIDALTKVAESLSRIGFDTDNPVPKDLLTR